MLCEQFLKIEYSAYGLLFVLHVYDKFFASIIVFYKVTKLIEETNCFVIDFKLISFGNSSCLFNPLSLNVFCEQNSKQQLKMFHFSTF